MKKTRLSPLFEAVAKADLSALNELLEKGLDVNATNQFGETPLFLARRRDVAELLVQHGADLEHQNQENFTVLEKAVLRNNVDHQQCLRMPHS